ncbi:RRP12-like protein [Lates japonicus]|uniref:RRP12-like protein n=1 Tax=Lates japonicus TaxID=270547 RepID=A0AAD3R945_LATJO|nr:RRP12-like protein [Lates japonicus]
MLQLLHNISLLTPSTREIVKAALGFTGSSFIMDPKTPASHATVMMEGHRNIKDDGGGTQNKTEEHLR